MGENTKIQWCDDTFNAWIGCTKVSEACKFCYAEKFAERYNYAKWGPSGNRERTAASTWQKPYALNRKAKKEGTRRRVFCSSLSDVFDDHASIKQEWRDELFKMIRETPHLDWLLLTKRPENYSKFLPIDWGTTGYPNVWLGVSIENKDRAKERMRYLINTPAAVRFISGEPFLEYFELPKHGIDQIIIGGESGPVTKVRPLALMAVQRMISQAKENGIKIFFKQLGSVLAKQYKLNDGHGGTFEEYPELLNWLKIREVPDSHPSYNLPTPEEVQNLTLDLE